MSTFFRSKGTVIRATEFHPSAAVALVAGLNGAASLIRVDGKDNPKMQGGTTELLHQQLSFLALFRAQPI